VTIRSMTRALLGCALLGAASSAWSIPVSTVGQHDYLRGATVLPDSGDEATWASGILGFTVTFAGKIEGSDPWATVDGLADTYAIDFGAGANTPEYFLVKTGGGKKYEGNTHFLFQNLASFRYGVVTLTELGLSDFSVDRISHTTKMDGPTTSVPEPASFALLGFGLLAAGSAKLASRRRREQV
jgi:hypothetical protein